jgi:hypothetical protein
MVTPVVHGAALKHPTNTPLTPSEEVKAVDPNVRTVADGVLDVAAAVPLVVKRTRLTTTLVPT